jgi:hypothetical protein
LLVDSQKLIMSIRCGDCVLMVNFVNHQFGLIFYGLSYLWNHLWVKGWVVTCYLLLLGWHGMNVASVSIMSLSLCYILQGLKPYTCCQSWWLLSLICKFNCFSWCRYQFMVVWDSLGLLAWMWYIGLALLVCYALMIQTCFGAGPICLFHIHNLCGCISSDQAGWSGGCWYMHGWIRVWWPRARHPTLYSWMANWVVFVSYHGNKVDNLFKVCLQELNIKRMPWRWNPGSQDLFLVNFLNLCWSW